jgi:hypothetical protein
LELESALPYPSAGRFTEFSDGAIVSHLIASGLFNSMANRGWIRLFHNVWVKKQDGLLRLAQPAE